MSSANPSQYLARKLTEAEHRINELEAEVARLRLQRRQPEPPALPAPSSLIESITDAFIALDKDFRYIWINAEAERLTGIGRDQLIGKMIWEQFPGSIGSTLEQQCRKALVEQTATEFENHYAPWNRWFWNKVYPTREGGLAIYWRDITEQKQTQAELQRQALVLQQVHDSIITTDLSGRITSWNRGAEKITGYRADEITGKHIELLYPEEDRGGVAAGVLEPLLRLGQLEVEMRNQHKSGREIYLRLSLSLLRDTNGEPYGMIGVASDITEQILVTRALRDSEERYRCLAEAMPQIAYTSSPDGKTQFVNQHWQQYSGVEPGQCLDFDWLNWIHPEDAPSLMQLWMECVRTGELFQMEYRLKSKDCEYRWQLSRAVPIRDAAGRVRQWVGTLTDIHELKSAEAALRLSEERFRLAVQAFEGIVYDWDLRMGVVQRIGDLKSLLGISDEEVEPTSEWWNGRIHPADLEKVNVQRQLLFAEGRNTVHCEYRIRHADGRWVEMSDRSHTILDETGDLLRIVGSVCEITLQKRLERELRESAERVKFQASVIATTTDAVIAIDGDHRVTYCNRAAEEAYGVLSSAVIGQPLSSMLTYLWLKQGDEQRAWGDLASKGTWSGENVHVRKDGVQVTVHSTVNMLPEESGGGMVAVIRDVSERKRAELELAQRAAQLARANEDLLHFAYAVGHDLQAPLRSIASFSKLLSVRYEGRLDERADQFIGWIVESAGHMGAMLHDLVLFAHAAGGPVDMHEEVSLESALAAALKNLRGELEGCQAVIRHDPLPSVRGDAGQISALLQNLIGNALKYRKPDVHPEVAISAEIHGGDWVISVRDNGIGFDQQDAERIFGVFQRLHQEQYPGTGIGLAICRRIVERFGGRIWATSRPGDGSVFSFSFPAQISDQRNLVG